MTKKEAYKILGASKSDDEKTLKSKYKKLLFLYHPDSRGGDNNPQAEEKIRLVIEAYNLIRDAGDDIVQEYSFDAAVNDGAFCERKVYVQYKIYDDEELPLSHAATGKYIWDPDIEEFSHFTKSVLEAARDIVGEYGAKAASNIKEIFHLLMQEFVLPVDSARKIGKFVDSSCEDISGHSTNNNCEDNREHDENVSGTICTSYTFTGFVDSSFHLEEISEPITLTLREDRALAETMVSGKTVGYVSFDEDAYYYVVLPLLEDARVETKVSIVKERFATGANRRRKASGIYGSEPGNRHGNATGQLMINIEMRIPDDLEDVKVSHRELIKQLLK